MPIPKTFVVALFGLALAFGQSGISQTAADTPNQEPAEAGAAVNINTADAGTLAEALDGVGRSRAQSIIDWREANGPFDDPYDLVQVRGISERIVSLNESKILVGDDDEGYTDE